MNKSRKFMSTVIGPFYDASDEERLTIETYTQKGRKPSVELLESVKLRPTYFSFPSGDKSPSLPSFRLPKYGYNSFDDVYPIKRPSREMYSPQSYKDDDGPIGRQTTVFGAIELTVSYFIGVGILSLPYALKETGWSGLIILILLGLIMNNTSKLIGRAQYINSLDTYPDIVELAFGIKGRIVVLIIFYTQLLFEVTIFMMLLTTSLTLLFGISKQTASVASTVIFIFVANTMTSPLLTGWLSLIGTVSSFLLFLFLMIVFSIQVFDDMEKMYHRHHHERNLLQFDKDWIYVAISKTKIFSEMSSFIHSFGIFCYCYMGHAALPSIFRGMQRPSRFPVVVNITFGAMVCIYTLISSLAYISYGYSIDDNIIITITTSKNKMHYFINTLVSLNVVTKFALASVPITESLFDWFQVNYFSKPFTESKDIDWFQIDREKIGSRINHLSPIFCVEDQDKDSSSYGDLIESSGATVQNIPVPFDLQISARRFSDAGYNYLDNSANERATSEEESKTIDLSDLSTKCCEDETKYLDYGATLENNEELKPKQNISSSTYCKSNYIYYSVLHILVRTLLPLISLLLSLCFSNFSTILCFMGGIFGTTISIIIPAACYLVIFKEELQSSEILWLKLNIIIGFVCTCLTIYLVLLK